MNNQKEEFQKETIEQLQMQNKRLSERLNKLYIDKLDGNISAEFWQEKHNEWNAQLIQNENIIKAHIKANKNFIESGIKILELAEKAPELYLKQNYFERAKLLKTLLSNCTLEGENVSYTYKKPFDMFIKTASYSTALELVRGIRTFSEDDKCKIIELLPIIKGLLLG